MIFSFQELKFEKEYFYIYNVLIFVFFRFIVKSLNLNYGKSFSVYYWIIRSVDVFYPFYIILSILIYKIIFINIK